jgi:hypothetical protein
VAWIDVRQTLRIATMDATAREGCQMKLARGGPRTAYGRHKRRIHGPSFKSRMFGPSDIVGGATPVPAAFFAIQSLALSTLSSAPALSLQTVTVNQPSPLRTTA